MDENKKWYIVHTRPGREKRVTEILSRRKIENYCPFNKINQHQNDREKLMHEPVFRSYAFVRIFENEIPGLQNTHGVMSFVYWLNKPVVIHDSEIETIKDFLNKYTSVKLERTDVHTTGEAGMIESRFTNGEGNIPDVKNNIAKVMLPSLGYLMLGKTETTTGEMVAQPLPVRWTTRIKQLEQKLFGIIQTDLKTLSTALPRFWR